MGHNGLLCRGDKPSIFLLFPDDLVSNRMRELPGEHLVHVLIRPGNHLSEAVAAILLRLSILRGC